MEEFRQQTAGVPVLKPLLTEVRVSATLVVGGKSKLALRDPVLYLGPCKIDEKLVAKLKSGGTVNLDIPPTSFDDVLQLLQKGLGAAAGEDSQV